MLDKSAEQLQLESILSYSNQKQAYMDYKSVRDAFKSQKVHIKGKVPFWGGEGVRKKGQISLVKEQKN